MSESQGCGPASQRSGAHRQTDLGHRPGAALPARRRSAQERTGPDLARAGVGLPALPAGDASTLGSRRCVRPCPAPGRPGRGYVRAHALTCPDSRSALPCPGRQAGYIPAMRAPMVHMCTCQGNARTTHHPIAYARVGGGPAACLAKLLRCFLGRGLLILVPPFWV